MEKGDIDMSDLSESDSRTESEGHLPKLEPEKCFQNLGLVLDDDDETKASNETKDKNPTVSVKHSKVLPQQPTREDKFYPEGKAQFALEIHEDLADPKQPQNKKVHPQRSTLLGRFRKRFSISYESLVWTIFTVVTVLCIVDHFVLNGDVVLGRSGKLPQRIWGTNVGETITNVVWAVTARLMITAQNLMFYTALWCIPNIIVEFAPNWLTTDGIREVHVRMHTIAGIFLIAIPSVAHVLVIFLPPIVDGTAIMYYPPSHFNYSEYPDHLNWTKFWDPAAVENWTFNDQHGVHLTSDELYRLSLMVILFCFLFPLTRSNYANDRSYSSAMALHTFAGVWYAIDNIRKITHGLAHVFNLPVLVIWCLDRVLSVWCYRRRRGHVVRQEIIGNMEYVVMYMKLDKGVKPGVGDVYYILHQFKGGDPKTLPQRAHPFTTFSNMSYDPDWDIGFIITIMEDDKQLCQPWTRWIAGKDPSKTFTAWGPYRSTTWQLYNKLKDNDTAHFILFATGSGFGYLLDVLSFLAYKTEEGSEKQSPPYHVKKIDIFFSVRCKAFYNLFGKHIDDLINKIHQNKSAEVTFKFYVTYADEDENIEEQMTYSRIQLTKGRIDFEKVLKHAKKETCCFFVGRPAIAEKVEKLCNDKGMKLYKDYTNSRAKGRDRQLFIKYLKISFLVVISIVFSCAIASIYIDTKHIKEYIHKQAVNNTK